MIEALVLLAAKYGPELVVGITRLFTKADASLADIEALFANVKPYSAYFPTPDGPVNLTTTPAK